MAQAGDGGPNGDDPVGDPALALPCGVVVVRDGAVVAANDLARAALDAGTHPLVGAELRALVHPDDAAVVDEATGALPVTGLRVRSAAGRPLELGLAARGDDLLVVVRDRTDERRLENIIDAVADRTMLLDESALVVWQSAQLAERFAHTVHGGLGVNPLERVHPEDLPTVLDIFGTAITEQGTRVSARVRSRAVDDDDVWQPIEIVGMSLLGDELDGIVVQVRNLDEGELVEEVGETQGRFLSLADAAPIGIVVADAYNRTVYRNRIARDLFGTGTGADRREWPARALPAYGTELAALLERVRLDGEEGTMTAAFEVADGSMRWLRVHATPRYADGRQTIGLIATLEDVTAEVEARAQTERLTQMLDASTDYVAVFRPDGEILYVNATTQRLLDDLQAEADAEGRGPVRLADVLDETARSEWIARAVAAFDTAGVWTGEIELDAGRRGAIPVSATGVVKRTDDGHLDWIAMTARDISERKEIEEQLRTLATHDHLTDLPNRPLFTDRLERAVARHRRDRRGVAVMFCDLDGFKPINDEYGHAAGDHVLVTVAERLRAITREIDTAARVGGDEFVIVCEAVTDTDELATLAERVIDAVSEPIELPDGRTVRVGISIGVGVARSREEQVDPDLLLTAADTAMYRAKARGGNVYRMVALGPR